MLSPASAAVAIAKSAARAHLLWCAIRPLLLSQLPAALLRASTIPPLSAPSGRELLAPAPDAVVGVAPLRLCSAGGGGVASRERWEATREAVREAIRTVLLQPPPAVRVALPDLSQDADSQGRRAGGGVRRERSRSRSRAAASVSSTNSDSTDLNSNNSRGKDPTALAADAEIVLAAERCATELCELLCAELQREVTTANQAMVAAARARTQGAAVGVEVPWRRCEALLHFISALAKPLRGAPCAALANMLRSAATLPPHRAVHASVAVLVGALADWAVARAVAADSNSDALELCTSLALACVPLREVGAHASSWEGAITSLGGAEALNWQTSWELEGACFDMRVRQDHAAAVALTKLCSAARRKKLQVPLFHDGARAALACAASSETDNIWKVRRHTERSRAVLVDALAHATAAQPSAEAEGNAAAQLSAVLLDEAARLAELSAASEAQLAAFLERVENGGAENAAVAAELISTESAADAAAAACAEQLRLIAAAAGRLPQPAALHAWLSRWAEVDSLANCASRQHAKPLPIGYDRYKSGGGGEARARAHIAAANAYCALCAAALAAHRGRATADLLLRVRPAMCGLLGVTPVASIRACADACRALGADLGQLGLRVESALLLGVAPDREEAEIATRALGEIAHWISDCTTFAGNLLIGPSGSDDNHSSPLAPPLDESGHDESYKEKRAAIATVFCAELLPIAAASTPDALLPAARAAAAIVVRCARASVLDASGATQADCSETRAALAAIGARPGVRGSAVLFGADGLGLEGPRLACSLLAAVCGGQPAWMIGELAAGLWALMHAVGSEVFGGWLLAGAASELWPRPEQEAEQRLAFIRELVSQKASTNRTHFKAQLKQLRGGKAKGEAGTPPVERGGNKLGLTGAGGRRPQAPLVGGGGGVGLGVVRGGGELSLHDTP